MSAISADVEVTSFSRMSGLIAILMPTSMFVIWWHCQKRLRAQGCQSRDSRQVEGREGSALSGEDRLELVVDGALEAQAKAPEDLPSPRPTLDTGQPWTAAVPSAPESECPLTADNQCDRQKMTTTSLSDFVEPEEVAVAQPSPKKVRGKKAARTRSVTWEKDEPVLVSPDPDTSAQKLMHKRRLQPKGKAADKNAKTAAVIPKLSGQVTQTDAPAGFWSDSDTDEIKAVTRGDG
mmetsp:Transcript_82057/g.129713  ORF Transcript_82057/g.129713 Transcript_82057/m.129713 type:complete len:235 (+) Transcript_82057:34-738(+)